MVSFRPFPVLVILLAVVSAAASSTAQSRASQADSAALERKLSESVKQNPDSFEARHRLAVFYLREGHVKQALPQLERAAAINPASYEVGYDLARALLETGRLDAARAQVKGWLAKKDNGELHNLLGDIEQRAGNLIVAADQFQRAAHLDPIEEHLFDWGDNLLQLRAYDPATEVFVASVKRFPQSARLRIGLGIAQYYRGEYQDAVRSFCDAADLAPSDPRPYQFLGEMYGVSPAQSDEITRRLARFVQLKPRDANGQYYYAMSLWRAPAGDAGPDLARIEALLRKATTLDARHAKARVQLGILLSEQRRWREAIEALQAAVALEPDLAQAHFRLAQAYRRTGETARADRELATFEALKGREAPAPPVPD